MMNRNLEVKAISFRVFYNSNRNESRTAGVLPMTEQNAYLCSLVFLYSEDFAVATLLATSWVPISTTLLYPYPFQSHNSSEERKKARGEREHP